MGLRLREGIAPAALAARFGIAADELLDPDKLAFYRQQGLVWQSGGRLGIAEAGMPLLDAVLGELVPTGLLAA